MLEVYTVSLQLTDEERAIALFWGDNPGQTGTPPGHWVALLSQIIDERGYKLDKAVEANCRLGIALNDAFIACWWTKYQYNLIRPISCIRDLVDPDWNSFIVTPPFPEYTSGHSVQSGAAAQVLHDFLGNIPFADHTHDNLSYPVRSFSSWEEAAEEAAISRLYGGIHYRAAIEIGVEQGHCIGGRVSALQFRANS